MPDVKNEHSVVIEAPAGEVYDYIADFRRHTEWNYQPQEITKVTEGPVGVGTVFHTKEEYPKGLPWFMEKVMMPIFTRLLGTKDYTAAEITAMEPGRRLAWTSWQPIRGGRRAIEVHWEIELEPENGATRVTQHSHWIGKHRMSDPSMLEDIIADGVEDGLNRLKALLEGRQPSGNGATVGAFQDR